MTDQNFYFHAYKEKCEIRNPYGKISSKGVRKNGLFYFLFKVIKSEIERLAAFIATTPDEKLRLWHERSSYK